MNINTGKAILFIVTSLTISTTQTQEKNLWDVVTMLKEKNMLI